MKFTQIRHGSHIIEYNNIKILVDPVFGAQGTSAALSMGRVEEMNPLLPLPFDKNELSNVDAVLITHMHFDHFDQAAIVSLSKSIPIYCHPTDAKKIKDADFINVIGIEGKITIEGNISIETINGGHHGKGIISKLMGRTTGYILSNQSNEPSIYIIGDSIWCDAVETAIIKYRPEVIIAFAGEARKFGKPITMSTYDLDKVAACKNKSKIIVNHMDAWNHCYLTRDMLSDFIRGKKYEKRFYIPKDGETISFEG